MSLQITPECIACGACVWECPTEAILPGDPRPVIESDSCTECYGYFGESQCAVVCPVHAITVREPEDTDQLRERFQRLRPGMPMYGTTIWQRH